MLTIQQAALHSYLQAIPLFSILVTNPETVFRKLGFVRSEWSDHQTTNINVAVIIAVLQNKFSS